MCRILQAILAIVFCVHLRAAKTNLKALRRDSCSRRTYTKTGCFSSDVIQDPNVQLIFTDHNSSSPLYGGRKLDWKNMNVYLRSAVCRCSREARRRSAEYFGMYFWGECYILSSIQNMTTASACFGRKLRRCTADNAVMDCAGSKLGVFVYRTKTTSAQPTSAQGTRPMTVWGTSVPKTRTTISPESFNTLPESLATDEDKQKTKVQPATSAPTNRKTPSRSRDITSTSRQPTSKPSTTPKYLYTTSSQSTMASRLPVITEYPQPTIRILEARFRNTRQPGGVYDGHRSVPQVAGLRANSIVYKCWRPVDIAILVDASSSVTSNNFRKLKRFLKFFVQLFDVSAHGTHVALLHFDHRVFFDVFFSQTEYHNLKSLKTAVDSMQYSSGATVTQSALEYAYERLFKPNTESRRSVHRATIVITDGRTWGGSSELIKPVALYRRAGIKIVPIGVGNNAWRRDLEIMSRKNVFLVNSYEHLRTLSANMLQALVDIVCGRD